MFQLTPTQLEDVRQAMSARVREGLAVDGAQLRALPAHVPPPPAGLEGQVLVLDCGGTNARAAVVELSMGAPVRLVAGPNRARLPLREGGLRAERFFDLQAELVAKLRPPAGLPLGYCFSYPSASTPDGDATLLAWTKGLQVPGLIGRPVGQGLREALSRRGLEVGELRVINDTVAALLSGALVARGRPQDSVGLIVGTGTNMALFMGPEQAPKVPELMAINLESGNFHPPHLTAADDQLDLDSVNPGAQRFEKAVSGFYLPHLLRLAVPGLSVDATRGAGELVHWWTRSPNSAAGRASGALLERSAELVAAALAGAIDTLDGEDAVTVVAEGGLFWGAEGYAEVVRRTLGGMLEGQRRARVERVDHANLVGAAAAALTG